MRWKLKLSRLSRRFHYVAALWAFLPVLIIIVTGIILQVKKEVSWVQPPTAKGEAYAMDITLDQVLSAAKLAEEANIKSWQDIDRLDVRPNKGVIKIRGKNRWEVQVSSKDGAILHVAYRRSDLIESIHDGSFFHEWSRLGIFLPAAILLLGLWVSGVCLFAIQLLNKRGAKKKASQRKKMEAVGAN
ncbi:MAG: PepSY domain-containing protein [Pseudobacteriovorax sp.]|nr:PepSY domain-containing protein [Pseudobacteriovorax sp.]